MDKICSKCKKEKDIKHFGFSRPNVYRSNCKVCQNEYNKEYLRSNPKIKKKISDNRKENDRVYRKKNKIKRNEYLKEWSIKNPEKRRAQKYRNRYGIDIKDYDILFLEQKGRCAICNTKEVKRKGMKYFAVDHCHKTDKVRGLLCYRCNSILGKVNDNIELLSNAIKYLKDSSSALRIIIA